MNAPAPQGTFWVLRTTELAQEGAAYWTGRVDGDGRAVVTLDPGNARAYPTADAAQQARDAAGSAGGGRLEAVELGADTVPGASPFGSGPVPIGPREKAVPSEAFRLENPDEDTSPGNDDI